MDRFFSKLDLRDIKIDPRGNRFPPDEAAYAPIEESTQERDGQHANGFHVAEDSLDAVIEEPVAIAFADADDAEWGTPAFAPGPGDAAAGDAGRSHNHRPYADDLGANTEPDGDILKVSARSRPSAVAGAIAGVVREAGRAEVQAIGAGATNQAVKAVAIARDYLRETGIEAVCLPAFIDITIDNEDRTAIRLVIEPR